MALIVERDIHNQIADFMASVDDAAARVPIVMAESLNGVAMDMMRDNAIRMDKVFEGGVTDWTKRALAYDKATPDRLEVTVFHLPIQGHYLGLQESGGTDDRQRPTGREPKALLHPIRGRATLDSKGNLPLDFIASKKGEEGFFVGRPTGRGGDRMPGLYRRLRGRLLAIVLFVRDRTYSHPIYKFKQWGEEYFEENLPKVVAKKIRRQIHLKREGK